ncbi:MAG: hypothetical protein AB4041_22530 [Microcystaceae cyanobacterium]
MNIIAMRKPCTIPCIWLLSVIIALFAVIVLPEETQETESGIVEIKVIEGEIEAIEVTPFEPAKLNRFNPEYICSCLAIATGKPLNINRLQEDDIYFSIRLSPF